MAKCYTTSHCCLTSMCGIVIIIVLFSAFEAYLLAATGTDQLQSCCKIRNCSKKRVI